MKLFVNLKKKRNS